MSEGADLLLLSTILGRLLTFVEKAVNALNEVFTIIFVIVETAHILFCGASFICNTK